MQSAECGVRERARNLRLRNTEENGYAGVMRRSSIEVLDPTAPGPRELMPLAAGLERLEGRVLGIRFDDTWKSFTRFAETVRDAAMRQWKVRDVILLDPGVRIGTTDEERRKVAGFVRAVDAAIVGLGT